MDHLYFYFSLSVSKSTKLFIIASYIFITVGFTKFRLITTRVINLLYFIVRKSAFFIVTIRFRTKLMAISMKVSSSTI